VAEILIFTVVVSEKTTLRAAHDRAVSGGKLFAPRQCLKLLDFSVTDILQQPIGWYFPAQPFRLGQLVNFSRYGKELRALYIAAL
jgi:hypothetical protein